MEGGVEAGPAAHGAPAGHHGLLTSVLSVRQHGQTDRLDVGLGGQVDGGGQL